MAKTSKRMQIRQAAQEIVRYYRTSLRVTQRAGIHEGKDPYDNEGWWVDAQIFVPACELAEWIKED